MKMFFVEKIGRCLNTLWKEYEFQYTIFKNLVRAHINLYEKFGHLFQFIAYYQGVSGKNMIFF